MGLSRDNFGTHVAPTIPVTDIVLGRVYLQPYDFYQMVIDAGFYGGHYGLEERRRSGSDLIERILHLHKGAISAHYHRTNQGIINGAITFTYHGENHNHFAIHAEVFDAWITTLRQHIGYPLW